MSYTLTVTLADPNTLEEHLIDIVTVDKHGDLISASVEAVQAAAKQLAARGVDYDSVVRAQGDSRYMDLIDRIADSYCVHYVAKTVPEGTSTVQYLVDATYSDYPEGGAWSDWVQAIDDDDATLQAKFIMAGNEYWGTDNTRTVYVKDFERYAGYMEGQTVNGLTIEPVTKWDAIDLLRRFTAAGEEMIAAFGNCGSPRQQGAANALLALVREAKEAIVEVDHAGRAPSTDAPSSPTMTM